MKDKSWIIILIMGIALTISITYSIRVSINQKNTGESTVTTTSIIEMKATTVTIKNTLKGSGVIEYKAISLKNDETSQEKNDEQNKLNQNELATDTNSEKENQEKEQSTIEEKKTYQITLAIENKDLNKVNVGQDVEITTKSDTDKLNYTGKVIRVNKDSLGKSTLNIEITNPDSKLKEQMQCTCAVILQKAENVIALPIEAIQKNELNEDFVDVVQHDGTTIATLIKTGLSDDYYVEITEGISVGERVQIVKSSTTTLVKNNENNK